MRALPAALNPLVIRTNFEDQQAWEKICELIRTPVREWTYTFYANVEFLDNPEFQDSTAVEFLEYAGGSYKHGFVMVVDTVSIYTSEHSILLIDLRAEPGRTFRALPSQIQAIENNLSIANMDFFEFADAIASDGIFRGFQRPG